MTPPESDTPETRICSQCKQPRLLFEFRPKRAFCVECGRAMGRIYRDRLRADPARRDKHLEQSRASQRRNYDKDFYRSRYGEKQRAQCAIRNRIRRGTLERQPCVICGATPADAHHEDYSQPTAIVWLCRPHHKAVHHGVLKIQPEQICHVR